MKALTIEIKRILTFVLVFLILLADLRAGKLCELTGDASCVCSFCDTGGPPQYNQTDRSGDSMLQQQFDLALDDPSNLPPRSKATSNINKPDPREFVFRFSILKHSLGLKL